MRKRYVFAINDIGDKFQFVFYGDAGDVILKSVPFDSVESCIEALALSRKCGSDEENYLRMISKDHQYYFMLRDGSGKELGSGNKTPFMGERNAKLMECLKYIRNGRYLSF